MKIEYETALSYSMSQHTLLFNLIEQYGLKNAKPVGTPVAEVVVSPEDMELLPDQEASSFRTSAGALLWITRCTRPDIDMLYT
jgi:hypothetical protein